MMQPPPVSLLEAVDNGTVIFLGSFDSLLSTCALLLSEAWLWCLPCSISEAAGLGSLAVVTDGIVWVECLLNYNNKIIGNGIEKVTRANYTFQDKLRWIRKINEKYLSSLFLIVFNAFGKLSVAEILQSLTTLLLPNFSDIKWKPLFHHHKFLLILSMVNMKDTFFLLASALQKLYSFISLWSPQDWEHNWLNVDAWGCCAK